MINIGRKFKKKRRKNLLVSQKSCIFVPDYSETGTIKCIPSDWRPPDGANLYTLYINVRNCRNQRSAIQS